MSTQKDILDALQTALEEVEGVNKVTQDIDVWNKSDPQDYNTLFINPKKPEVERFAYLHETSDDMQATLEISIEGNTYSQYESEIASVLDGLMINVEKAIIDNNNLNNLVIDIVLDNDEFISSIDDRYGIFSAMYIVEYLYNHNSP